MVIFMFIGYGGIEMIVRVVFDVRLYIYVGI